MLTYSGLAPEKFDRLTPNSFNPAHYKYKLDKSVIQFVRASLLIDHTHDTFYFPSCKILHLPVSKKSQIHNYERKLMRRRDYRRSMRQKM